MKNKFPFVLNKQKWKVFDKHSLDYFVIGGSCLTESFWVELWVNKEIV